MKKHIWWILPSLSFLFYIPDMLGYKASLCDHVVYAAVMQLIMFPVFLPLSWLERITGTVVNEALVVIISILFYLALGLLISKWKPKIKE
jgi:hypothetical protein